MPAIDPHLLDRYQDLSNADFYDPALVLPFRRRQDQSLPLSVRIFHCLPSIHRYYALFVIQPFMYLFRGELFFLPPAFFQKWALHILPLVTSLYFSMIKWCIHYRFLIQRVVDASFQVVFVF
jgi:hypothetical protein